MAWTVEYTGTARNQLSRLDRDMALRVVNYMDERVAVVDDPRRIGQALTGPLGGLWRYWVGRCRLICDIQDDVLRVLAVRAGRRDEVYR